MAVAILALTILLLPAGFPYFAPLGLVLLFANGALAIPALPRGIWLLLALLSAFLLLASSFKGIAQFSVCLLTLLIFARIGETGLWRRLAQIPVSVACTSLVLVALSGLSSDFGPLSALFVPDEYGGEYGGLRFRLIFSEPNHFVAFLMFGLIILNPQIRQMGPMVQGFTLLGALVAVAAAASPLGYAGILIYIWSLSSDQPRSLRLGVAAALPAISLVAFQFLPGNVIARIDYILDGQDNSLNFRTWGSVAIAATTLSDLGQVALGVGLGGSRAVLDGNPYMVYFAAEDQSVLPSFLATTLLEVGAIGIFLVMALWARLLALSWRHPPVLHGLSFAIANCVTGSFFFDNFSWAAFGLATGMALSYRPRPDRRERPAASIMKATG